MLPTINFRFALLCVLAVACIAAVAEAHADVDAAVHMKRTPCGSRCFFRFCKSDENQTLSMTGRRLLMRDTNSVVNPWICRPQGDVGKIFRVGEALIRVGEDEEVPISEWAPEGLSPTLPADYFTVGRIPGLQLSGILRKPTTVEQYPFLDGLCVVLPIRRYQLINPETGESRGKRRGGRVQDCIAFRTIAPKMFIELFWETSGDFDLKVIEPSGNILDREHPRTRFGRFNNDNGIGECEPPRVHHEVATYFRPADLETGEYTLEVRQSSNCMVGRTRYTVRVVVDGITILDETDRANSRTLPSLIKTLKFTL